MDQKRCPLCRSPFKPVDLISEKKLEEEILDLYPKEIEDKIKSFGEIKIYKV